jgi:hypothetical protein
VSLCITVLSLLPADCMHAFHLSDHRPPIVEGGVPRASSEQAAPVKAVTITVFWGGLLWSCGRWGLDAWPLPCLGPWALPGRLAPRCSATTSPPRRLLLICFLPPSNGCPCRHAVKTPLPPQRPLPPGQSSNVTGRKSRAASGSELAPWAWAELAQKAFRRRDNQQSEGTPDPSRLSSKPTACSPGSLPAGRRACGCLGGQEWLPERGRGGAGPR